MAAKTPCNRVRPAPKYHKQMLGRAQYERRRLGREYLRIVRAIRAVSTANDDEKRAPMADEAQQSHARAEPGDTPMERAFWREFGHMLGVRPNG